MLIRLLRAPLHRHRRRIAAIVLLQLLATLAMLYLPTLNADIIDDGVLKADTSYILGRGGIMLAITAGQICCSVTAVRLGSRVATAIGRDLRSALFDRTLDFSAREMGRFGTPSLITRTTNDVGQVQMFVQTGFTMGINAPIVMVGGIVMALNQNVRLSTLLAVVLPVLALILAVLIRRMRPLYKVTQGRLDALNRILREQIGGARVIRAFVREPYERERFAKASGELMDVSIGTGRLTSVMFPALTGVVNVSTVAVLWFGGHLVADGRMPVGALTAFLTYLMQILMSVLVATFMFMIMPRAEVSAERITEVLDTEPSVAPPARPVPRPAAGRRGNLELRAVGFSYPGAEQPVLSGIDLVAEPGRVTAVVGSTGAGKSTLLSLVPRLMDATAGRVLVDGVDVRDLDPTALTEAVGYVPQRPYLFSGTVASNLRYGNEQATDAELWHALDVAQARDFVETMPDGLASEIAQGGTNVSGGQRQRLAIARTLVRKPGIYLFDDSFSALDYATDARLRAALAAETGRAAVVIVAQRVSTVRHADSIVVLDAGRVVGRGRHQELMESDQIYREIVLSQLSEQEALA